MRRLTPFAEQGTARREFAIPGRTNCLSPGLGNPAPSGERFAAKIGRVKATDIWTAVAERCDDTALINHDAQVEVYLKAAWRFASRRTPKGQPRNTPDMRTRIFLSRGLRGSRSEFSWTTDGDRRNVLPL